MSYPFGGSAFEIGEAVELEDGVLYFAPWIKKYGLVVWRVADFKMWVGTKPDERGHYSVLPITMGYGYKNEDFTFAKMAERLTKHADRGRVTATL